MKIYLRGIGIAAPGLPGWSSSSQVLAERVPYRQDELPPLTSLLLPANERRRATKTIKLALQVAHEALQQAQVEAGSVASVFASAEGDMEIVDRISSALTLPDRPVSPTDFHNSVHNAPAGYFAIGGGSHHPSVSLSCAESTVAAGLREAATQVLAEGESVLLICYDHPAPATAALHAACPMVAPFGAAFLFSPVAEHAFAALELTHVESAGETVLERKALEVLRNGNAAARTLPLLKILAEGGGEIVLPLPDMAGLSVRVTPC